ISVFFFFSSRRRHTRSDRDWSSDVCSSDLLVIPPFVLHGMKGIGTEPAFLINVPTEHYVYDDPDEFRVDPHSPDVPYRWERKDEIGRASCREGGSSCGQAGHYEDLSAEFTA